MKDVHELAIQLLWSPGWQLSVAPARVNIFRTWLGAAKTFFWKSIILELLPHYKRFIRTIYIFYEPSSLFWKQQHFKILNLYWFGHKWYLECPLPNHVCPLCEITYQFTRSTISETTVLKGRVVTRVWSVINLVWVDWSRISLNFWRPKFRRRLSRWAWGFHQKYHDLVALGLKIQAKISFLHHTWRFTGFKLDMRES